MTSSYRLVIRELDRHPGATAEVMRAAAASRADVQLQVRELNNRLRSEFGYTNDPIDVNSSGAWKVDGVAGVMRLNSSVELEVVPKFLDPASPTWRVDFLVLAVLVRSGRLLSQDEISAVPEDRGALATLVAQSLLIGHDENERRPIRGYARRRRSDFAIDGEVDWESVMLPDSNGFELTRLELTRQNSYNATMLAALEALAHEVTDLDTQARLEHRARSMRPQVRARLSAAPLPARSRNWQTTYDLSQLVVDGLGLDLRAGPYRGPGFVLPTWLAWEQLCEHFIARAMPRQTVIAQQKWRLGTRGGRAVSVRPDLTISGGARAPFLLDAKYKARQEKNSAISSTDLYESLAFMRAAGSTRMTLLYPSRRSIGELPTGAWNWFDRVIVDDLVVEAAEVQVQGLARANGLTAIISGARFELGRLGLVS